MRTRLAPASVATALASLWLACAGASDPSGPTCVPATETCDGVDDDCDGVADEPGSAGCTTYYEDRDQDGFGGASACLCAPAAPYTATIGGDCDDANPAVHPGAVEACNGVDDDCDALVDEAIAGCCAPSDVQACGVDQGVCKPGTSTCGADFAWGPCLDAQGAPVTLPAAAAETCNGLDDDCDGSADEPGSAGCTDYHVDADADGSGGAATACLCAPTAPYTAIAGGDCDDANAVVHPGAAELCNGIDDDCDGSVDLAGGVALARSCYGGPPSTAGVGACRAGTQTCAAAAWGECQGEVGPSSETCNGSDDDCSGTVDDVAGAGTTCTGGGVNSTGSCYGLWTCTGLPGPGPGGLTCAQVVGPRPEECNGLDDDCDGSIDEDPAGQPLTISCYDGMGGTDGVGACVRGTRTCSWGGWGGCEGEVLPSPEVCNGKDDDCDGAVDTNVTDPWAGQACCPTGFLDDCANTGAGTRCSAGTFVCASGGQLCSGGVAKSAEICNGVDDDCDGAVDDIPGLGNPCSGGGTLGIGACRAAYACNGTPGPGPYGLTCTQVVGPAPETCNGIDDDCDGTVDESPTDVGGTCCAYASCSAQGAWACSSGVRICVGSTSAVAGCTPEACNGVDDDCDGVVDDVPGIGTACTGSGLFTQGACRAAYACPGGASGPGPGGLTCVQVVGPVPETCNGIDDDCDGTVDDNPTDVGGPCCAYASCSTQGRWACSSGVRSCFGSAR